MRAMTLRQPGEKARLYLTDVPVPALPTEHSLLVRVHACGVCHTDGHIAAGELPAHKLPLILGHQAAGKVHAVGAAVTRYRPGDRVGVTWLHSVCGECEYCRRQEENLCPQAQFSGWDVDGGYAEYVVADERCVVPLPESFTDVEAAPLLCAGIIGFRALRLGGVQPGDRVGLFGFGASAHLALQVARYWQCGGYVFTRSREHQTLARSLGAEWTGTPEETPPTVLDRAIIFAPAGALVPLALARVRQGGVVAINAIHMSPIPEMNYNLLYGERVLRSVANATVRDAQEFMQLAAQIPLRPEIQLFPLSEAQRVLELLQRSELQGAGVLVM